MKRYAAFLRGVMPTNVKMPALAKAFEAAGFEEVKTVLSSGNVLFSAEAAPASTLERRAERAMEERLGTAFLTIVRPVDALRRMLAGDPYAEFRLPAEAKRIVTFLRRRPRSAPRLPVELHGARILGIRGAVVFGAYVPSPKGPVFMSLLERTFGKEGTTRTWDTVGKVAHSTGSGQAR